MYPSTFSPDLRVMVTSPRKSKAFSSASRTSASEASLGIQPSSCSCFVPSATSRASGLCAGLRFWDIVSSNSLAAVGMLRLRSPNPATSAQHDSAKQFRLSRGLLFRGRAGFDLHQRVVAVHRADVLVQHGQRRVVAVLGREDALHSRSKSTE